MSAMNPTDIHEDDAVSVRELPNILDAYPDIDTLSLDCFDTLLWRRVHKPSDVFWKLEDKQAFQGVGLDASQRVTAEQLARQLSHIKTGGWEVTLGDILRTASPDFDAETITRIEEEELQAEIDACFPLPEAIALLRAAAKKNMRVVIVSDTYFKQHELRRLLECCLPEDAYNSISVVVVSCENGASKGTGLFEKLSLSGVLSPGTTLHVGDNPNADLIAPLKAGIRARVLYRFSNARTERMQDRAAAWRLVAPDADRGKGMPSPWHSIISRLTHDESDPVCEVGQTSLGPMMHAFASWILAKRKQAQDSGVKLKVAFLMRDGYLPMHACAALAGEDIGKPVYISRFSAFAASFRGLADIDRYLAMNSKIRRFDVVLKQLGIKGAFASEILRKVERAGGGRDAFFSIIRTPSVIEHVTRWSANYRKRMYRHLFATLDVKRGDTLALVDLGYFGNIQRSLAPVMREEWGIEILGWYFLCYPQAGRDAGGGRDALINRQVHGEQTLRALLPFMATLETLCTAATGSVRDYAEDGSPILEEQLIHSAQEGIVGRTQEQAIAFIETARNQPQPAAMCDLRDAAMAELVRLFYMPARHELDLFASFSMDENMGSDLSIRISEPEQAITDMRRDGIFFATRMRPRLRRNLAHELRHCGMELSLATLSVYRNALSMRSSDWSMREEVLPLLYLSGQDSLRQQVVAHNTYDGFFRARIPIGSGSTHVGIIFGERYKWVQICDAAIIPVEFLQGDQPGADIRHRLIFDQISDHGNGVLECNTNNGFAMLPAGCAQFEGSLALEIVFRPIVIRSPEDQSA